MADEIKSGQIRLKVDPKALRQAKNDFSERTPAPIITEHDVNGRTLSMRKDDEPIQMITPAAVEALPMEVVEAQQSKKALKKRKEELDVKNKQRKHPKRVLTNAEKNYWRVIVVSLFISFAILIVAAGVAVGTVSFFLLSRVIENPAHAQTLHNAAAQIRNAGSLSEKYEIMVQTYNEVRNVDLSPVIEQNPKESKYKKVLREVEGKVNRMHSIDETMPEAPEMKNTLGEE